MSQLRLLALLMVMGGLVVAQSGAWGQDAARTGNANAQTQESVARPKPAAAPSGNVENGKKLFTADGCYQCHGFVGQGSTATGARIGPPAIPFQAVVDYVRHPSGQMPPYTSKVLSDSELADIYAYLKSQPTPQSGKSIPLLNQ